MRRDHSNFLDDTGIGSAAPLSDGDATAQGTVNTGSMHAESFMFAVNEAHGDATAQGTANASAMHAENFMFAVNEAHGDGLVVDDATDPQTSAIPGDNGVPTDGASEAQPDAQASTDTGYDLWF